MLLRKTSLEKKYPSIAKNTFLVIVLTIIGSMIGLFGSLSFHIGYSITYFWPAIIIQLIGGLWFGIYGVAAGVLFPIISDLAVGTPLFLTIMYIPANFIQSFLPVWSFRRFEADICLRRAKDQLIFLIFGVFLTNVFGALWGSFSLVIAGYIPFEEMTRYFVAWFIGNTIPALVLGELLLLTLSPYVKKSGLYIHYWFE
ncbi:MAG: hypothetical protein ACP6IS_02945 [Candidatus Asgardarchaeia archaeon]